MFLVVSQHITTFWGDAQAVQDSVLDQTLMTFRMPLFFFISGFIAYKSAEYWNLSFFKQRMITKAQVQLIPAVLFFMLFALCYGKNPLGFLSNGFGGFWFTPVLFGMFCIYFPCCYLLRNRPKLLDTVFIIIAVIAAVVVSVLTILGILTNIHPIFIEVLKFDSILYYFEFFILGHFIHKYEKEAFSLLSKDWINLVAIIVFTASILIIMQIRGGGILSVFVYSVRTYIARYAGLFIIFSFFIRQCKYFAKGGLLSRVMQYVGRHTLDIYMIHNFFLPMNIDIIHTIVKTASHNVITQILVEGSFATIIIAICLLISNILRNSNTLSHYLFGVKRITSN